ncbi:hypothetical protein PCC9214_05456 (plasmid) [Planktothrix tepida]|uniref:Uncharacterized protein n=1 Tax=Planktothrix tepida PCC 9214 TaxID=671072 RepID=A0A1J1LMZ7_9CYAN|nr:hypothetical protein [Planktothrix tepida]CAD5988754.1 hypothetical protein PCC9214_05456 [Planktothrix tepida]CUR33941.1 conserved hypothetical protein [Planktothrix tepida PCC 9214]
MYYERHPILWTIHSAFPGADFWLISRHSQEMLGKPVQEYQKGCFGLLAPQCYYPKYAFYLCDYLWSNQFWDAYAYGCLNLQHLRITDVREFFRPGSYIISPEGKLIVLTPPQLATA